MIEEFNLTAAAEKLGKNEAKFKSAVKAYGGYSSILTDLEAVERALEKMPAIRREAPDEQSVLGQAVMSFAVVMYCRALVSEGVRSRPDIERHYSVANKIKHNDIRSFRNATVAHLDAGKGSHGGKWLREYVILKVDNDTRQTGLTNVYDRLNATLSLEADLWSLVLEAIPFIRDERAKKAEVVLDLWEMAGENVRKSVVGLPFDRGGFFSASPATEFLDGRETSFQASYQTIGITGPLSRDVATRMFPDMVWPEAD